jgi:hypothetical protein
MNESEGIVESISQKNHGIKIDNTWLNSISEEVDKQLEKVLKGDKVKFKNEGKDLIFIESLTTDVERDKKTEGMVRHGVVTAFIQAGEINLKPFGNDFVLSQFQKDRINALTKFIMEGA